MPAKENAAEQQQQSQLAAMRSELGEMRRFVRSLLALELAKRTLAVVRVQAGWRAARDRRGVVARAFRARRRLRVLVSTWLLHVSVPAPAGSAALRARLHALGRGFLVRRRLRRYLTQHRAARRLQATTRGGRARRAWRLALVQHRRALRLEAELAAERRARRVHEAVLRTLFLRLERLEHSDAAAAPPATPPPAAPSPAPAPVLASPASTPSMV